MNNIKYIFCTSVLIIACNSLSMHQLSQPGNTEAFLTILGLRYLDGENQNKFFELLNQQATKSSEFRNLCKLAMNKKINDQHPQFKKIKIITPIDTKAYFPTRKIYPNNSI